LDDYNPSLLTLKTRHSNSKHRRLESYNLQHLTLHPRAIK